MNFNLKNNCARCSIHIQIINPLAACEPCDDGEPSSEPPPAQQPVLPSERRRRGRLPLPPVLLRGQRHRPLAGLHALRHGVHAYRRRLQRARDGSDSICFSRSRVITPHIKCFLKGNYTTCRARYFGKYSRSSKLSLPSLS